MIKLINIILLNLVDANGNVIGEQAQGQDDIYVNPAGLKNLLLYIKEKYDDPELYVTENGEFCFGLFYNFLLS